MYNPNRLKLYVRDKLAVENFLEYLKSNQAFSNYIEGEISFDILDDDKLPDISTTSREGLAIDDERVVLLIKILKLIVNKLIRERIQITRVIDKEEKEINQRKIDEEKHAKEAERRSRRLAEAKSIKLGEENINLKAKNISLKNQNEMKDILLSESDPQKQKAKITCS